MYLLTHAQGIWLPLVALLVTSIAWRDMKLFIGAVMFLPYIAINVLAKNELSGLMDSYKAFPLVVSVMWPSIVMLGNDDYARKRYAVLQCVVLACGLAYIRPGFIEHARQRWIPQPMVAHAQEYSDFGAQTLATLHPEAPTTRATQSILALYPYQFPVYLQSGVAYAKPKDYRKITTLIWFANDRDMGYIQKVLKTGKFTIINVPNTYIRFAVRK